VRWHVNPHSGVPLYVQLEQQVKTAIAAGVLAEGDRLPTVRELALELTINPNTVARAYRELERAGFIETTPGRGTFVKTGKVPPMPVDERRRRLEGVVDVMLAEARALGFADEQVLAAVTAAIGRTPEPRPEGGDEKTGAENEAGFRDKGGGSDGRDEAAGGG